MSVRSLRTLKEEYAHPVQVGGDQPNEMGSFLSAKSSSLNRFDWAMGGTALPPRDCEVKVGIRKNTHDARRLGTAARHTSRFCWQE